jgi:uncharacterized membrane protein YcaP (DUF421 family)
MFPFMLISFIRAFILYAIVVIVMRVMGKRQLAEMQPFELVVTLMIADLAAIPMENSGKPLLGGIIPIIALTVSQLALSWLTLKSERIRAFICGSPSILIEKGIINQTELEKQRINLNDLLEQLRSKDIPQVNDVEFAVLETGGQLNVIPKSQKRPITPEDLNIDTPNEGIPLTIIMDGRIHHQNLKKANLDISWLTRELKKKNLLAKDVFFACLYANGQLEIQTRERKGKG